MFSIVAKTNKGRRYYYLREQRRIGDKVRPKDFYLGRMDAEVVPYAVIQALHAAGMYSGTVEYLIEKAWKESQRKPIPGVARPIFAEDYTRMLLDKRRLGWIRRRFIFKRQTIDFVLGWWKVISEARACMRKAGTRMNSPKEKRWINGAGRKVAALEKALAYNRAHRRKKALAFYR